MSALSSQQEILACPHLKRSSSRDLATRRYAVSELRALQRDMEVLAPALAWVEDVVAQSHSELGRPGKVCPFVPEALTREMLQFFVLPAESGAELGYAAVLEPPILQLRDRFLEIQTAEGKLNPFLSFLMVFRGLDLDIEKASFLIEDIQRKLKPEFVERGLMLGEFHPFSDSHGLRNPDFRPLRSPTPMLVIRNMVEVDFAFLNRPRDPAPMRVRFLTAYLRYIGGSLHDASRRNVESALALAQKQSLETA